MGKKAQVIIITLWILVILTVLTISIGHRVSMALRLSRYQRDSLKALYLAKAGLNRAIVELENDLSNPNTKDYDTLIETWSHNEDVFREIRLTDNKNEYAQVSYDFRESKNLETRFGVIDEERKININKVPQGLLEALLNDIGVIESSEIAHNICAWRGDTGISIPDYVNLGYFNKGKEFTNVEELVLVKGIENVDQDILRRLKDLITVWGDGRVNINTASEEVFKALGLTAVTKLQTVPGVNISEADADALVEAIISFRDRGEYFKTNEINTEDMKNRLALGSINDDNRTKIINELISMQLLTAVSENFRIESTGYVGQIKKKITAVVKRAVPIKTVFWHEN